ncbi:FMN-dependent NADH-azoreductase [Methylophaga sp. OBS3]|uniref:FMN-dependent NADH-azoreductase n=1 Tax=Methylophaga sp. OBS3 TaxID=2991934 RepID=UPI00225959A7|nr:NAD(P)H-dependent oxidoreductase [Methylophaga sp. OBS3]MCX4189046.1 NAD(P)H-dependent oxidoreductase [Methylophaga sp. OBS3]
MGNSTVLLVNASSRYQDSLTRVVATEIAQHLAKQSDLLLQERDVATGLPFINEEWVNANFTDPSERSDAQKQTLSQSDLLVQELQSANQLVIGVPVYNFSIPATLKAWIDLVARARETFRYTENGPEGLLKTHKTWLVAASGGVPIGSDMDFATRYLRQVLGFLGITDVTVVNANDWVNNQDRQQLLADLPVS